MSRTIHIDDAPEAIGPNSQAIQTGNMLSVSGLPKGKLVEVTGIRIAQSIATDNLILVNRQAFSKIYV